MKLLNDFFTAGSCRYDDGGFTYNAVLNPAHFIYAAHFPKNPVTPGVCILQMAEEILEQHEGCELELKTVNSIKYMAVISPGENAAVDYRFTSVTKTDEEYKVRVTVSNDSAVFAKMALTFRL